MPLETSDFIIPIFQSISNSEPKQDGFFFAHLPSSEKGGCDSEYAHYRIGLTAYNGAETYTFHAQENPTLMASILWYYLKQWGEKLICDNVKADIIDRFDKYISFIVEDFTKGQRVINAHPYWV